MMTLFAFSLLFGGQAALAGGWEAIPYADESQCDFRFSGPIGPGDLTGHVETIEASGHGLPRLCLDSGGGSLAEVFAFIERMEQSDDIAAFATRIRRGRECLGACAILFMFGQRYGANSPSPSRIMEPGARLGFRSPLGSPEAFPEAGQGGERADDVHAAFDLSQRLLDSAYRARSTAGPALGPEALALALGTPPGQTHHVDTIGEMKLLGISFKSPEDGMTMPDDPAAFIEATNRICAASHVLSNPRAFVSEGYDFADLVSAARRLEDDGAEIHQLSRQPPEGFRSERITALASGPYHVPFWFSAGAALFCQVEFAVEPVDEGLEVSHYNVGFGAWRLELEERLARPDEISDHGLAVGLLPIDHPYR